MELKYKRDDRRCTACSAWETSEAKDKQGNLYRRAGIFGKGTGKNGLLLVADSVNAECVLAETNFQGPGSIVLNNILLKVGINPADCYYSTLVRCKLPGNKKPAVDLMRSCQETNQFLDLPSKDWRPKLVVLLGASVLQAVTKATKIEERRGKFSKIEFLGQECTGIATYSPNVVLFDTTKVAGLENDFRNISNWLRGIKVDELAEHMRVFAYTRGDFIDSINRLMSLPDDVEFALDIESTGLDRLKDEITSLSLTYRLPDEDCYHSVAFLTQLRSQDNGVFYLEIREDSEEKQLLNAFFEKKKFICHYGDFDIRFLWRYGLYPNYHADTVDAHLLLEEDESHKLKFLVKKFVAAGAGYEQNILAEVENNPGDYANANKDVLLTYNSDDTYFTRILDNKFSISLKKDNLYDFYFNHAMPTRRVMSKISQRGILINKDTLFSLAESYREKIKEAQEVLYGSVGIRFNENSPIQLRKVLFEILDLPILAYTKAENPVPSTDKTVLTELAKISPVVNSLQELRHLKKMCTTYLDGKTGTKNNEDEGDGILSYVDERNRIHSTFFTDGTNSGRLSSRSPNLQNIPKESDIRNIFVAPPGWKLVEIDYKTAELVLLAYLSQDQAFIKAVNERDLHVESARMLLGIGPDQAVDETTRTLAKRINFRKAYRGGPKGLAEQLGIDVDEAIRWYKMWDEAFPDIVNWFNSQDLLWRKQNYIESIYGRRKHFADCSYLRAVNKKDYDARVSFYNRIAANFPCQSAVGDTTNRTIFLFEQALDDIFGRWYPDARMYERPGVVLTVHDSVIFECPVDMVDDMLSLLTKCATIPLPQLNISLQIDTKITDVWMQKKEDK